MFTFIRFKKVIFMLMIFFLLYLHIINGIIFHVFSLSHQGCHYVRQRHTYLAQGTPWPRRRFPQGEAHHCTPVVLTLAIDPNVVNSGAQFLLAGDCVRAIPLIISSEKCFRMRHVIGLIPSVVSMIMIFFGENFSPFGIEFLQICHYCIRHHY